MSDVNQGGPAFPVPMNPGESYQGHAPCDGMTLRDYFAAKAMQALIANANGEGFGDNYSTNNKRYAYVAYVVADSMIAERNKEQ